MSNSTVFMSPTEMAHEEIRDLIRAHQEKVRWFEEELVGIKLKFKSQRSLPRFEVEELKKTRRRIGMLKERHQEKIRELKRRGAQLHTTNES